MRVERLPFTVYDILGYLIPGLVGLWGALFVLEHLRLLDDIRAAVMLGEGDYSKALAGLLFLACAYITGHIFSFLSSVTVENLAIAYYGFPSNYVCRNYCKDKGVDNWSISDNISKFKQKSSNLFVNFLRTFLLPIFIFMFFINKTNLIYLAIKGLPASIIEMMDKNFQKKTKSAGLTVKRIDWGTNKDWFRFVCFYSFNNYQTAAHRLYNYLTIYGFTRNMCFIAVLGFWFYLFSSLKGICVSGMDFHIYWPHMMISAICAVLSNILYFEFIKFYRRYTEEAILAFATTDDALAANKGNGKPAKGS